MVQNNRQWFLKGVKDGLPISLGYLAVSFTLGIAAKKAGLSALQAALASLTLNASAGEFVGFTLIAAGASYLEVAVMELVANIRYILMSCALSQKLDEKASVLQRLLIGYDVTDEIFGISIAVPDKLNPYYTFGAIAIAAPGWATGTLLGAMMGEVLPIRAVSALGVGLYGMFVAVIIPPAKKDKVIASLIVISFAASYLFSSLAIFNGISSGIKIIILTVIISFGAAVLFPVHEKRKTEISEEVCPERDGYKYEA